MTMTKGKVEADQIFSVISKTGRRFISNIKKFIFIYFEGTASRISSSFIDPIPGHIIIRDYIGRRNHLKIYTVLHLDKM